MKKFNRRGCLFPVSSPALLVVFFGSLLILCQLGYIAFDILGCPASNRLYTVLLYRKCFDYILLELSLLIGGAFLFDITARDMASE